MLVMIFRYELKVSLLPDPPAMPGPHSGSHISMGSPPHQSWPWPFCATPISALVILSQPSLPASGRGLCEDKTQGWLHHSCALCFAQYP